ncbi:MAG: DUF1566 domain-containing protein [Lachnospiraceae bacterium]|nr:DUF1566 domain-containing protein [Lachnospiraceae bacterium]
MAKKKIDTPIESLDISWEGYKGRRVREFLQKLLQELSQKKLGWFDLAVASDGMATMRGFASEEDFEEWSKDPDNKGSLVLKEVSFYTSGSASADYTLAARISQNLTTPMVMGASNILKFTYNSYYGGDPSDLDTEKGYAKFTINSAEISALTMSLEAGGNEYSIDLGSFLTQESNIVKVEIGNQHGKSRTWTFTVQAMESVLSFDPSYDESMVRTSNWPLRVACRGVSATIHLFIDGKESATAPVTNSTYDFMIDAADTLAAGAHSIELYAENADYGIRSQTIRTAFIKSGLASPSICIGNGASESATMYGTAIIPYFFYFPSANGGDTIPVSFEIRDLSGQVIDTPSAQTVVLGSDKTSRRQEFRYTLLDSHLLDLGKIVVAIKVGSSTATTQLTVIDAGVTLEAASECKVMLSAAGKTNADTDAEDWHSEYNGVRTCTVRRSDNFKLIGENGFNDNAFLIKAGKSITLDVLPFASDFGANAPAGTNTGKTFEFEFETSNCTNSHAEVISCLNNGVGFVVYADMVELHCGDAGVIKSPFPDERRERVGFCIDGTTTHCVNKLIDSTTESDANIAYMYINGVIGRIMDYAGSSWKQTVPQNIKIGSDECDVKLYTARLYDKSLTYKQMIGNLAYDTPDLDEKIAIARRNNVLDSSNAVSYAKVLEALPNTPQIIWELDKIPTSKKDKQPTNTEFINPRWVQALGKVMASFVCKGHTTVLDGTSSLSYPDPYKNWGADYKGGEWIITIDGVEIHITSYSITEGVEDGETEFVHKVNFASSECIVNILAMNAYHNILTGVANQYPDILTPPQREQQSLGQPINFRHSLSGFPEIGWLRSYTNGQPNVRFLSLFNFINNKYSPTLFGFDKSGEHQAWEVEDNVNFFMENIPEGTWVDGKWNDRATTLYYARIPKKSSVTDDDFGKAISANGVTQANSESKWIRRFHNWVQSCNPNVANRYKARYGSYQRLPRSVTYGDITYTEDAPAYRLAKFDNEHTQYGLVKASALFYFLFCDGGICGDSFDKNMTLVFCNTSSGSPIVYIFLRDTDTWMLYNNRGALGFLVFHEWGDTYDESTGTTGRILGEKWDPVTQSYSIETTAGSPVFNGRLSGLWDCVQQAWGNDLKSMYQAMRASGFNADSMFEMYNGFWEQFCEALYNVDAMGYANTGRFNMAHGDKREVARYFFKYRFRYLDSKYGANTSNALELRLWGTGSGVALRHYCPIYASLNWGAGEAITKRSIVPGEPALFESTGMTFNETTFTVYDADLLTEISSYTEGPNGEIIEGGLEGIASTNLSVTGLEYCKRLKRFVLDFSGRNPNTELSGNLTQIKASKALQELVVRNCSNMRSAIDVTSEVIETIDFRETPVPSVTVPATDSIKSIQLGNAVRSLTYSDCANLETLTVQGVESLNTIDIVDCPKVDVQNLVEQALSSASNALNFVRATNINWSNFAVSDLIRLAEIETNLTGVIGCRTSQNLTFEDKKKVIEAWGNVDSETNPLRVTYNPRTLTSVTISGAKYFGSVGKYKLGITPNTPNANNFTGIKWSITGNIYATIDERTGELNVTSVGDEDRAPTAKVTVEVTLANGDVVSDTVTIGFYDRSAHLGDYVYADGSYSDILDRSKTPIGICFYIDENNPLNRLAVQMQDNFGTIQWGLYFNNGTGSWAEGGNDDLNYNIRSLQLVDDPQYNCYDIAAIVNIGTQGLQTSAGANSSYVNDDTYRDEEYGDSYGFKRYTYNANYAVTDIGFVELSAKLGKFGEGDVIPRGLIKTLQIIAHRDKILDSVGLAVPHATDKATELENLNELMAKVVADNDGKAKYRQFYYPAASLCHAYEPTVKVGETLSPKFKAGMWFLPSVGELMRMYWYHRQGYELTNPYAIFARARQDNVFTQFTNTWYWSASENSQSHAWGVNFNDGITYNNTKCHSSRVRAVVAF